MIDKKMGLSNIRSINIEDLLGRPPIKIKLDSVMDYVSGKTVLVTGGGGSIGSELCRQIAEHSPHKLIISISMRTTLIISRTSFCALIRKSMSRCS